MGNARPQVMPNDAWVVANDTRLQLSSPKCRVRDLSAACKIPVAIIRTTPSNNALLPQDALICAGDQLCIVSNRSVDDPCITVPIALIGAYLTICTALQTWSASTGFTPMLLGAFCGYFIADFVTGLAHLYFDTSPFHVAEPCGVLAPLVEVINKLRVTFRWHHLDPQSLEHNSFTVHLSEAWLALTPFTVLYWALLSPEHTLLRSVCLSICASVSLVQISHRMSHRRTHYEESKGTPYIPWIWRLLQDYGVVLHPSHHSVHHRCETSNFCILSGVASSLLDIFLANTKLHTFLHDATEQEWAFVLKSKGLSKSEWADVLAEWQTAGVTKSFTSGPKEHEG